MLPALIPTEVILVPATKDLLEMGHTVKVGIHTFLQFFTGVFERTFIYSMKYTHYLYFS